MQNLKKLRFQKSEQKMVAEDNNPKNGYAEDA
jgi:hypothetical protein